MNPTITPQCGREPHLTGRLANEKGQRIDIGNVKSKSFKRVLRKAGLRGIRYHDLRHGAASLMAVQGVPARVAMELLGHSQIATTMNIYTHVTSQDQREASAMVSEVIWGKS
ncbi:MAG: tyrosine-type recombinase/integrase [Acidobacteria bacterium]|nr:tyrosine-type recombinase/integrase [Acidobacteriota bacterium]